MYPNASYQQEGYMTELEQALVEESYAASPAHILEGLTDEIVHRKLPNVPHTIYGELWHMAFWQQITLDWITGVETPYPAKPTDGFPPDNPGKTSTETSTETFDQLRQRFLLAAHKAADAARNSAHLDQQIRCPSRPGSPVRIMSIRDQLISLAAHNASHLGRIVLLRQLMQAWPPASGGFTW
jgi:hypothetical protein